MQEWGIAWQSAGRTADPWIGPDILQRDRRARRSAGRAPCVCACGFFADHLEVLYDLDIEARARAEQLGLAFARTASLNDAPELARSVAGAVLGEMAAPAP